MSVSNDLNVVRSVRNGNVEDYALLVREHQSRVISFCFNLLRNIAEAEDAAQDIFVKAYSSLDQFRGESSFSTWICRIAHNHCLDILRRKSRQKTDSLDQLMEDRPATAEALFASTPSPNNKEERFLLEEALASLGNDAREILTLREVGGLTYDEIAGQLNCSIDAVKSRLKRARQELQQKARHFLGSSNVQ